MIREWVDEVADAAVHYLGDQHLPRLASSEGSPSTEKEKGHAEGVLARL